MPFIVTSRQIFKEIVNGSSFTDNPSVFDTFLKSNAISKNQAIYSVSLSWESKAQIGIDFTISGNTITRPNGSFIDDGFIDGDAIEIVHNGAATTSTRNISSVSDTILIYDSTPLGDEVANNIQIHGITDLTGVEFTYLLTENANTFTEANQQDGSVMQFRIDNLNTSFQLATFSANPITGENGKFECRKITVGQARVQEFEFKHEFINFPYFLDAERAAFEGGSNINILENSRCLKYAFRFKAGKTSQNPNERKFVFETENLGNTGGFDENFNGNTAAFAVESITYTDTGANIIDSLDVLNDTNVEILVNSPTGINLDANHKVIVYFSKLPEDNDIDQSKTFEENFVVDSLLTERGAGAVSSTAIEDLIVTAGTPASDQLKVNFTMRFNASQQAMLNDGDSYIISVEVDDLNNLNTFTTNARADVNTVTKSADVEGLFTVTEFGYYRQDMEAGIDTPFSDFKGWNEDMILQDLTFGLDTALSAKIQDLTFRLVAFNTVTESFFEIYSNKTDLETAVQDNNGVQQINIESDLNYNLPNGDNFKRSYLENNGTLGTLQLYRWRFPFRLSYADYLPLNDVDGVFFDNSQPLNGLNQKLSNYSGVNDYEIRVFVEANVSNDDFASVTLYRSRLPFIEVYDYEEDAATQYSSANIELQTLSGLPFPTQEISRNQDTLIKATCVFSTPVLVSDVLNGVLRLEEFENGGNSKIQETDSLIIPLNANLIQPLSGETKLKVTNNLTEVVFEGVITEQVAQALPSTNYSVSVRPFKQLITINPDAKVTEDDVTKDTEDGTEKEIE